MSRTEFDFRREQEDRPRPKSEGRPGAARFVWGAYLVLAPLAAVGLSSLARYRGASAALHDLALCGVVGVTLLGGWALAFALAKVIGD